MGPKSNIGAGAVNICSYHRNTKGASLDARSYFFFYATGITPAMSMKMVGVGPKDALTLCGKFTE